MPITIKNSVFIDEYMVDMNATQAAIRAKYSEKSAYSIGSELLSKPEIQAELAKRCEARAKKTGTDNEWVIKQLQKNHEIAHTREVEDLNASTKAVELIGKHHGTFNADAGEAKEIRVTIVKADRSKGNDGAIR